MNHRNGLTLFPLVILLLAFQASALNAESGSITFEESSDGSDPGLHSVPPQITGISPNPVPGSPIRQWITLHGSDFSPDFSVTLRNETQSVTYPVITHPDRLDFTDETQLQVFAGVGEREATWSATVHPAHGNSSETFAFQVSESEQVAPTITGFEVTSLNDTGTQRIVFHGRNLDLSTDTVLINGDQKIENPNIVSHNNNQIEIDGIPPGIWEIRTSTFDESSTQFFQFKVPGDVDAEKEPFIWPVEDVNGDHRYLISRDYSDERPEDSLFHSGIDIAVYDETFHVVAAAGGVVVDGHIDCEPQFGDTSDAPASDCGFGHGNWVLIHHPDLKYKGKDVFTFYSHLNPFEDGTYGFSLDGSDSVIQGQALGRVGSTGNSTGLHLHFEARTFDTMGNAYRDDLPDSFGYFDPRLFMLSAFDESPIRSKVFTARASNLAIRSGPATTGDPNEETFAVLDELEKGQTVSAYATYQNGSEIWYKIDLPNANGAVSGWVPGVYDDQQLLTHDPKKQIATVTGESELHQSPGSTQRVMTRNLRARSKAWPQQQFAVLNQQKVDGADWFKISLPNVADEDTGWISGEHVRVSPQNHVKNERFADGLLVDWSWGGSGAVHVVPDNEEIYSARLASASPIFLRQGVDTPDQPIELSFDYRFVSDTGKLQVRLESVVLATIESPDGLPGEASTYSVQVSDPEIQNLDDAVLEFRFDGINESQIDITNVHLSGGSALSLWHNASRLGSGWSHLSWFGYFADFDNWIFHYTHGWQYYYGKNPESFYFFDPGLEAWGWSSESIYPWVYLWTGSGDGSWYKIDSD